MLSIHDARSTVIVVLAVLAAGTIAAAADSPATPRSIANTFVYDHRALRGWIRDKTADPYVLAVDDGDYFQVVFEHTDPRVFSYSISADEAASPMSASSATLPEVVWTTADAQTSVTMRHDRHFVKYRVTVRVREDLRGSGTTPQRSETILGQPRATVRGETPEQPSADRRLVPLYSVSFDLWVRTRPEWTVSFSGGFAFSDLTDPKYFVKTDEKGNKTVEQDANAEDGVRHDVVALANVYYTQPFFRTLQLGVAFGVGDSEGSTPRYFVGPSVTLGKGFILTAGKTLGSVKTLPAGQALHAPLTNGDNTLNTLGSRFTTGWYVGIGFTFINRETEFKGAFSSTTTSTPRAPEADQAALTAFIGTYQDDGGVQ